LVLQPIAPWETATPEPTLVPLPSPEGGQP
jgi:hypothetical protein